MDSFGRPEAETDFGDRRTYGEVVLTELGSGSALSLDDWRRPPAPPPAPARRNQGPKLYLNAKPGTLAQERDRAREVVEVAKHAMIEAFDTARLGKKLDARKLVPIVDAISASVARNCHALPSITRLKTRSEYTYLHSVAVCGLMVGLAQELRLDRETVGIAGLAGLLHDIGKAVIPRLLIEKPGPLTDEEFDTVKLHPQRGFELLGDMDDIPDRVREIVLHHHERMDGRGYPHHLPAGELDLLVRMATVCDVYDAVTSTRAYKDSWSPGQAIAWMRSAQGHFDHMVLNAFIKMLGAFPPGSLVRLRSELLALVLDDPNGDPMSPMAIVFHCAIKDRPVKWRRVATSIDPIVGIERPESWQFDDWECRCDALIRAADVGSD